MVTWHIVDDDVECLHVERNPTITCSGSHLYKFYRLHAFSICMQSWQEPWHTEGVLFSFGLKSALALLLHRTSVALVLGGFYSTNTSSQH
jgi:hypothetical protein